VIVALPQKKKTKDVALRLLHLPSTLYRLSGVAAAISWAE